MTASELLLTYGDRRLQRLPTPTGPLGAGGDLRISAHYARRGLLTRSPESYWNRVISGAEVRILDQCLTDIALNVTLRALFAVAHIIAQHQFGPYIRDDRVRELFAS